MNSAALRRHGGSALTADAVGLVAGFALDLAFGDPRRLHPVAGFGQAATALESQLYAPRRRAGAVFAALAVGGPVLVGAALAAGTRRRPVLRAAFVAAGTWAVLGGRSLRREAATMAAHLQHDDLAAARSRLGHLCGRNPSALDETELSRATVESVAENTSDSVVAPLFWGAVAGLPGLLGYRAANTLDAMVGHRSARYVRFGTPAARLDDVLNLLPSRLTALLMVVAAPLVGQRPAEVWRVWRRDGDDHPSPNAGHCESAMAGALGVRLGGRNVYFGRVEIRPLLGDGPRPAARDIRRAARMSGAVGLAALGLAAAARAAMARAAAISAAGARAAGARAAGARAGGARAGGARAGGARAAGAGAVAADTAPVGGAGMGRRWAAVSR